MLKLIGFYLVLLLTALIYNKHAVASEYNCGVVDPSDGLTWDYFDLANHQPTGSYPQGHIKLVTNVHLTSKMNNLETGNTGSGIIGFLLDLDYTLRRIPNHPKALDMASRFQVRNDGQFKQVRQWQGSWKRSAECYFDRAFQFTSKNPVIHMLYGMHLHRTGNFSDAEKEYKISESLQPDSVELQHNMGLLYFELKNYDLSANYAKKAYDGGYPLPGLRNKLMNAGKWPEPDDSQ